MQPTGLLQLLGVACGDRQGVREDTRGIRLARRCTHLDVGIMRDRGRHSSSPVEVTLATGLAEPLNLLAAALRDGDPVPEVFADRLRKAVEAGDVEVLAARAEDQILGVALLAYRLNVSAGGLFASIEDLHVRPDARGRGVGRALLKAVDELCAERGISYVEAQVEETEAELFYAALGYEPETDVRVLSRSLPTIDDQDPPET
jgi:GNAT superfamily N-acetyltransferase